MQRVEMQEQRELQASVENNEAEVLTEPTLGMLEDSAAARSPLSSMRAKSGIPPPEKPLTAGSVGGVHSSKTFNTTSTSSKNVQGVMTVDKHEVSGFNKNIKDGQIKDGWDYNAIDKNVGNSVTSTSDGTTIVNKQNPDTADARKVSMSSSESGELSLYHDARSTNTC